MKKSLVLIFSSLLILVCIGFAPGQTTPKNPAKKSIKKKDSEQHKKESEFVCQYSVGVVALELSPAEIVLTCPVEGETCSNKPIIKVAVVTVDTGQQKYVYTVSAGKIVGEGANVEWDLSDVKPGSYTITAGISQPIFDGAQWEVLGKTKTKVIIIKE